MPSDDRAALVLFSGGQDSTTCLFWALHPRFGGFGRLEALAFQYGQRHAVELEQARKIAEMAGVPLTVLDAGGLLTGSALTEAEGDTSAPHERAPELPAAFVPGRNALFLAAAASLAYTRGIRDLVTGVSEAESSGYPDCRRAFLESFETTMTLALDRPVRLHAPLMDLSKAETWKLAKDLGDVRGVDVLETVREMSHTDYHGDRSERHAWGYGRLDNPASVLRAKGYEEAVARGWL